MRAQDFLGTHDFTQFSNTSSATPWERPDPVRVAPCTHIPRCQWRGYADLPLDAASAFAPESLLQSDLARACSELALRTGFQCPSFAEPESVVEGVAAPLSSQVKTIHRCEVSQVGDEGELRLEVEGSGFLHRMVRHMAGEVRVLVVLPLHRTPPPRNELPACVQATVRPEPALTSLVWGPLQARCWLWPTTDCRASGLRQRCAKVAT